MRKLLQDPVIQETRLVAEETEENENPLASLVMSKADKATPLQVCSNT